MKLVPYGKNLQQLSEKPFYIFIFMGKNAWIRAKNFHSHFPSTLVLPPKQSPFDFIWPINNHDIIILDTGITDVVYVRELVACLFSFGANVINYLSQNVKMTEFQKD